jgi:hypothetical protein
VYRINGYRQLIKGGHPAWEVVDGLKYPTLKSQHIVLLHTVSALDEFCGKMGTGFEDLNEHTIGHRGLDSSGSE